MSQFSIICSVYRGGTSRGLFFRKSDLPDDTDLRNRIFMAGIDSYNPTQINGLGSGTSHASKVCVISPSSRKGVDVEYTFYQIGIGAEIVDDTGTCGNLMAAVGTFAVDEGLVPVNFIDDFVNIAIFNTNIGKMLRMQVPLIDGKAKVSGDYLMPGVTTPGAKIMINILAPGGGKTGKTLPLGINGPVKTKFGTYSISFVDVVNPFVFIDANDLRVTAAEENSELSRNPLLLEKIELIRRQAAVQAGMATTEDEVAGSVPKFALIMAPQTYVTSAGRVIKKEEVDIVAKMVSMGKFHRTFAGSGLYCLAAATLLPGTIPNRFARKRDGWQEQIIRIGHPEGIAEVRVSLTESGKDVASVGLDRTARRIIKGELYIPR
ncbi:PrpF domain-containing protein [Desulfosporosinus sp. I2]|uniref:PrpF domain-containing protein n=1 Tax=Desulfosporosinus sp. I2 TaxID=1617025 RepID=UPI0005EFC201|nr:PrpF domain-containing protein [Desulfosporosinus sp. I2]